jgi:hypothetical protein
MKAIAMKVESFVEQLKRGNARVRRGVPAPAIDQGDQEGSGANCVNAA